MPAIVTSAVMRPSAACDPAAPAADVVVVHRPRQHDVGVRVEAVGELLAVVLEVRLDLRSGRRRAAARPPGGRGRTARRTPPRTGSSPARCRARATSRATDRHPARRRSSRRRGSAGPPGSPGSATSTARSPRRSHAHRPRAPPRAAHAPGTTPPTRARAAHPSSRRPRTPTRDAERVGERGLDDDLVADRDDRERGSRTAGRSPGSIGRRTGRALAAAEHVRAHHEEPVGVDRPCPARRCRPTTRSGGGRARPGRRRGCRR